MINIDTKLFLEIIVSEGARLEYSDEIDGIEFEYYQKGQGKVVSICVSDEYLPNRIAKGLMKQLGFDELIIRLFPTDDDELSQH